MSSSTSQDIIDFMNGNYNKKNSKIVVATKHQKQENQNNKEVDQDGDGKWFGKTDSNDDDDVSIQSPSVISLNNNNYSNNSRLPFSSRRSQQQNQILQAYQQIVVEWVRIDQEQIYPLLQSILNIRQRIYHTMNLYFAIQLQVEEEEDKDVSTTSFWKSHGYRNRNMNYGNSHNDAVSLLLNQQDLQMSIDYNLQHQERMIVELRHQSSNLSQMTNTLSRRYEELYLSGYNGSGTGEATTSVTTATQPNSMVLSIDDCLLLYTSFAKELYRKQTLVSHIIASSTFDRLLSSNNDSNNGHSGIAVNEYDDENDELLQVGNHSSIRIVQLCIKKWLYQSNYSHVSSQQLQQIHVVIARVIARIQQQQQQEQNSKQH